MHLDLHFCGVLRFSTVPSHNHRVILEPLPKEFQAELDAHNSRALEAAVNYVLDYAQSGGTSPSGIASCYLPLSRSGSFPVSSSSSPTPASANGALAQQPTALWGVGEGSAAGGLKGVLLGLRVSHRVRSPFAALSGEEGLVPWK